jgi:hypothetical protein
LVHTSSAAIRCLGFALFAFVWLLAPGKPQCMAQSSLFAAPPRPAGDTAAEGVRSASELRVESFWVELSWASSRTEASAVSLKLGVRLSSVPDGWLQIAARVQEGYRISQHEAGEWVPFYFMVHSPEAEVELQLQQCASEPGMVELPVVVQAGAWHQWLRVYLRGSPKGHAAAAVLTDSEGQPLWFRRSQTRASAGAPTSFWALPTRVGESLVFISEVLGVHIDIPGYLSPWCGISTSPASLDSLLSQVCHYAGCAARRVEERRYVVSFVETYRGAPDASWFVVKEGQRLRYHAEDAPATALLPALVEVAGEIMGDSPDLVWPRVSHTWRGGFHGVLASICDNAVPPLQWEPRNGAHYFELASRPGPDTE